MGKIGVIDYSCGNITSLVSALRKLGGDCIVSSKVSELGDCAKLILPGVGAFPHAMRMLKQQNLIEFLQESARKELPILGICLGMQILFESSDEFGPCDGLGILRGHVKKLPDEWPTIPNIGWWGLEINDTENRFSLTKDDTFYFVHSFFCNPINVDNQINIAIDNIEICAMVQHKAITAVQFHPEKSQKSGQKILSNFIKE